MGTSVFIIAFFLSFVDFFNIVAPVHEKVFFYLFRYFQSQYEIVEKWLMLITELDKIN